MDLDHPHRPLTADQRRLLAQAGLEIANPVAQYGHRDLAAFWNDRGNFFVHFRTNPSVFLDQTFRRRPVFRRLSLLFPDVLSQAQANLDQVTRQPRANTLPFFWRVYHLMSQLVDRDDFRRLGLPDNEPDDQYLLI